MGVCVGIFEREFDIYELFFMSNNRLRVTSNMISFKRLSLLEALNVKFIGETHPRQWQLMFQSG